MMISALHMRRVKKKKKKTLLLVCVHTHHSAKPPLFLKSKIRHDVMCQLAHVWKNTHTRSYSSLFGFRPPPRLVLGTKIESKVEAPTRI